MPVEFFFMSVEFFQKYLERVANILVNPNVRGCVAVAFLTKVFKTRRLKAVFYAVACVAFVECVAF